MNREIISTTPIRDVNEILSQIENNIKKVKKEPELYIISSVEMEYLANLQQENQQISKDVDMWNQKYNDLFVENQHLKENNKSIMEDLLRVVGLYNQQKSVLDEIREYIKERTDRRSSCRSLVYGDEILLILDKVKE